MPTRQNLWPVRSFVGLLGLNATGSEHRLGGVGCRRPTPGWKLQPTPPFRSLSTLRASRRNRRPSATAAGSNPVEAAPRTTTLPSPRRRHEPPYIPQAPACPALPSVPSSSTTQPIVFFPCPKIISSPEAGRKRPTSQAPPRVPRSARQWLPRRRPAASSRSPQSSPSPSAASRRRRRGRGTRWAGRTGGSCRRRRTRTGSTPTGPPTSPSTSTTSSVQ